MDLDLTILLGPFQHGTFHDSTTENGTCHCLICLFTQATRCWGRAGSSWTGVCWWDPCGSWCLHLLITSLTSEGKPCPQLVVLGPQGRVAEVWRPWCFPAADVGARCRLSTVHLPFLTATRGRRGPGVTSLGPPFVLTKLGRARTAAALQVRVMDPQKGKPP